MKKTLLFAIMLLSLAIFSCSDRNQIIGQSTSSGTNHGDKSIEVRRSNDDKSDDAKIYEIVTRLENPTRIKSMTDSVHLTDVKTGKRYSIHCFREALGVRSSNEEKYLLKIYEDNSLYGIDPLYSQIGLENHP